MTKANTDFNNRVREIELYFSFIENVFEKNAQLLFPDQSIEVIDADIHEIFKANGFLLLYNLAESGITNAIAEIYADLDKKQIRFDDLKDSIKKEIVRFLKNNVNPDKFVSNTNNIAHDIIQECFEPEKLLSGSLDARKIKEFANQYGFSTAIMPINFDGQLTHINSDNLLTVKNQRNDLAHGVYSFAACGKDFTLPELINIKNHVIAYLRQILNNIENYLLHQQYLSE